MRSVKCHLLLMIASCLLSLEQICFCLMLCSCRVRWDEYGQEREQAIMAAKTMILFVLNHGRVTSLANEVIE